jgi:hypothetical protein
VELQHAPRVAPERAHQRPETAARARAVARSCNRLERFLGRLVRSRVAVGEGRGGVTHGDDQMTLERRVLIQPSDLIA